MKTFKDFFLDNRSLFLLIFLGCASLLGAGYILQYAIGLTPCPLCIIQRFFFALVGLTALAAFIQNADNRKAKFFSAAMIASAFFGGLFAARQIWLQYQPKNLLGTQCAPWIESITKTIGAAFKATADCAEISWTLLSLSIPEWSIIAFVGLALVSSIPFWKK